ncbi:hypothetical protein L1987_62195 [Smallanthus sonchifolius]|uniref:Uncharacterized protein n=1 Tax=Smallanthus sonchifolius TaxID=185202 RepID=A0ACB9C9P4_9ASTR|nr:hypothetical protein L1987_62195 [Smallanthus sonchifolius]
MGQTLDWIDSHSAWAYNIGLSSKEKLDGIDCAAVDTISANQAIKDGETIVSHGEMYELGFFSPGNTKNRYLGIWYKKISTGKVVWVANRETPINDTSVSISVGSNSFVAQLLDTGNLVVWDRSRNSTNQNVIWESFDYPGDTLLPGMKFGKNMVTGLQRFMTSWKSPDDPSSGLYDHILDTNGYPQIFGRQGSVLLSRLGPWTGVTFSGFATEIPNPVFSAEFVINQKEIYHKYELVSSVVERRVLTWDGKIKILRWIDRKQEWVVYVEEIAAVLLNSVVLMEFAAPRTIHPVVVCKVSSRNSHKNGKNLIGQVGVDVKSLWIQGIGTGFRNIQE